MIWNPFRRRKPAEQKTSTATTPIFLRFLIPSMGRALPALRLTTLNRPDAKLTGLGKRRIVARAGMSIPAILEASTAKVILAVNLSRRYSDGQTTWPFETLY